VWEILRAHSQSFDLILEQALSAADAPEGFAVMAVGRLGTCELDVVSDADLVFLRTAECDSEAAEHCAHSLVAMLSGYTREGSVIAVDTRIRPHGGAGEFVVSSRQLAQYFQGDAKPWEMLAFGKLRFIAGARHLGEEAAAALSGLQKRFTASPQFLLELRAMRKRIADSGAVNSFKTSPGGLYDIDFVLGMLEARAASSAAGKQLSTRLEVLAGRELLPHSQARELLHAAELFRRVDHANRVVEGRSRKWLPTRDVARASVENIVGCPDLDGVLRTEMRGVRAIFDSFFRV
jgi:glutamate-ammonia-ligase adenylyltransferase